MLTRTGPFLFALRWEPINKAQQFRLADTPKNSALFLGSEVLTHGAFLSALIGCHRS